MRDAMRRYDGKVDVVIMGAGAGGSSLAKTLAEGGMSVVVLEAGDWHDTQKDFVNDELTMLGRLDWDDPRESDGQNPIKTGRTNTGRGIGGSTLHFTAMKLRLHPDDMQLRSREGIAVDWPLSYEELEPFYEEVEHFLPVSGPRDFPWGHYKGGYPQGELMMNAGDEKIATGFDKLGMEWRMTPHAVLTAPKDGRSPCMNYGFCTNGCKSDAKGGANVTWVPYAVKAGVEFRERCFVTRVEMGPDGRARGLVYIKDGAEHLQEADRVVLAGYSIETPRLLLNSAPGGLANSSGMVGKNLMVHPGSILFGRYEDPLDNFVTPPVGIMTQDPYGTRSGRIYPRGFMLNRYQYLPIEFATTMLEAQPDLWGSKLMELMDSYPFWTIITSQNEMLPRESNSVTLGETKDQNGLPVAKVTMSFDPMDEAMLSDSQKTCEDVLRASGAVETQATKSTYHVLGTCRMGSDPASSVVNADLRSWDVPNLYICDGSVFSTIGAVNPSLTIEALAVRAGRRILAGA